jgi:hypothetical protein
MLEAALPERNLDAVRVYHERTKHRLTAYAAGPDTLDWDAQPDPFRRYIGAPLMHLPLSADQVNTHWADLFAPGRVATHPINHASIGLSKPCHRKRLEVRVAVSAAQVEYEGTSHFLVTASSAKIGFGKVNLQPHPRGQVDRANSAKAR